MPSQNENNECLTENLLSLFKRWGKIPVLLFLGTPAEADKEERKRRALFEEIKQCLDKGADVNARDEKNNTLLLAVLRLTPLFPEDFLMLETLIDHGADLDACDTRGNTSLHIASSSNRGKYATLLLKHGANKVINSHNEEGLTPLHYAVKREYVDLIRTLLEHGADIGSRDKEGNAVLHYVASNPALGNKKVHIAELLFSHGAHKFINERNNKNETPPQLLAALSDKWKSESGHDKNAMDLFSKLFVAALKTDRKAKTNNIIGLMQTINPIRQNESENASKAPLELVALPSLPIERLLGYLPPDDLNNLRKALFH